MKVNITNLNNTLPLLTKKVIDSTVATAEVASAKSASTWHPLQILAVIAILLPLLIAISGLVYIPAETVIGYLLSPPPQSSVLNSEFIDGATAREKYKIFHNWNTVVEFLIHSDQGNYSFRRSTIIQRIKHKFSGINLQDSVQLSSSIRKVTRYTSGADPKI